ncbi:MAG: penicillin-binding protein, partial [Candidatus Yanofskybacteria bacterium]|nr:penicillin-binding protein [Candidatus Yanofskybacteria bacterium]
MKLSWSRSKELLELPLEKLKPDYWVFMLRRRPWLRNTLLLILLLFCLGFGAGYSYIFKYTGDLKNDNGNIVDFSKLNRSDFKKSSTIYANDGKIIGRLFEEIRSPVKSEEIPSLVKYGFIAAEDKRFNPDRPNKFMIDLVCDRLYVGVDPCAIIRAGLGQVMRIRNTSGASGIPSQITRLNFGDEIESFRIREHSYWRKFKEAKIAIQLNKRYPKDKIIENFLNLIYFGRGVNGIAEATQRYFGKDIRRDELTLQEIAILVSMNKSPSIYSPVFNKPDLADKDYKNKRDKEIVRMALARDRYNWVLGRMMEDGYISRKDYKKSLFKKDEDLDIKLVDLRPLKNRKFDYGNRVVKEFLLGQKWTEKELSSTAGLRIHTTIDTKIQKIASEEFEKHLAYINTEKVIGDKIDGAFVIIEVKTGNILAMSGGHDFNETQYNRVFATRSPGSGFKPLVYAAALEQGKDYFDQVCNCSFTMR